MGLLFIMIINKVNFCKKGSKSMRYSISEFLKTYATIGVMVMVVTVGYIFIASQSGHQYVVRGNEFGDVEVYSFYLPFISEEVPEQVTFDATFENYLFKFTLNIEDAKSYGEWLYSTDEEKKAVTEEFEKLLEFSAKRVDLESSEAESLMLESLNEVLDGYEVSADSVTILS